MAGRRAANLVGALVLAAAASSCGHTRVVGVDRTVELAVTEYRLIPQSIRARTGPLTIYAHNYGRLTHNLVVSIDGRPAGSTEPIRPGQTAELTLTLTPGNYLMASTIVSDRTLGTYGTLIVSR
jgi:hypothetical protein